MVRGARPPSRPTRPKVPRAATSAGPASPVAKPKHRPLCDTGLEAAVPEQARPAGCARHRRQLRDLRQGLRRRAAARRRARSPGGTVQQARALAATRLPARRPTRQHAVHRVPRGTCTGQCCRRDKGPWRSAGRTPRTHSRVVKVRLRTQKSLLSSARVGSGQLDRTPVPPTRPRAVTC